MIAFLLLCLFVVIILVAITLARMSVLSTRLGDMEGRLRNALGLIGEIEKRFARVEEKPAMTQKKQVRSLRARPSAAVPVPAPVPTPAVRPAPAKSRTKEEWESFIGGKLLNRIGALALILGVGFFLQYAFANDWITEPVRVLIGVFIGLALLGVAARSASGGFQIFAQGLVGAGIAILYLSVYASFNYYHIVLQGWAFICMSVVTVITFTQAFKYNSIVVALLGWLGGFLTPFLLSTGEANPIGLFTYLALLNLGLLVVAWRIDSWMAIEPLSMAGTYLIYALWLGEGYAERYFIPGLLYLALFWLMFHAVHTIRVIRHVTSYAKFRVVLASLHGAVFYILLVALLDFDKAEWRVPATLVAALLYGATSLAARRTSAEQGAFLHSTLSAVFLIICATWIQFKGLGLVQYLSVEALALTWAGTQWKIRPVWASGLALFAGAFLLLFVAAGSLSFPSSVPFTLLLNRRAFTYLLLAACLALGAVLLGRAEKQGSGTITLLVHIAWCFLLFILITIETNDWFARMIRDSGAMREQHLVFLRLMALPVVWGTYALLLVLGGTRTAFRPVVNSGLVVLLAAGCLAMVRGLTFVPIGEFASLLNDRVLFLLILVAQFALARRILVPVAGAAVPHRKIVAAIQAGIVLLILVLITGETWDYFARGIYRLVLVAGSVNIEEEMSRLQNLRQLLLSTGWLVYSIVLMALGIWKRNRVVRIESIILFGVSILKIFIYDLSFLDTLYRIFSFIGLGVILLAVSYLYQRYRGIILGEE